MADICDTCGITPAVTLLTPDDTEDPWPICTMCLERLKKILLNAAEERGIPLEEVLDDC
jgi:hypothetical protein